MKRFFSSLLFISFFTNFSCAQNEAIIKGKILNEKGLPLQYVTIAIMGVSGGASSDSSGAYQLKIPSGQEVTVQFTHIGFTPQKERFNLASGETYTLNPQLKLSIKELKDVTIEDAQIRTSTLTRIEPKTITMLPSPTGGVEGVLKTLPGVSSNNEMSSQYSVRGGNFDENLVYVNDIEIYRPFLVRAGEQEGLSFVNSDMISSILFSAGGFEARYGDKMSSVLDIKYRKPDEFAGSATFSLLEGALHTEGISKNKKLTYQLGVRQKSNQYLLKQLNTKGEYKPSFTDIQGYITCDVSEKTEISFLGSYARNRYLFIPETRETRFGTVNEALRLLVFFDGQEVDRYETLQGAFSAAYSPNTRLRLKLTTSVFKTTETETFDIMGQYWLDDLEKDFGDEKFGEAILNKGVGTFLNHARNELDATVMSIEHKGFLSLKKHFLQWGAKYRYESINDKLSEWKMIDSSGYSLPHNEDSVGYSSPSAQPYQFIELQDVLKTMINISSNRFSGYLQDSWNWTSKDTAEFTIAAGIRANYWDLNEQFLMSPRVSFSVKPRWKRDIVLRAAAGFYHQPPFYRELRGIDGKINTKLKAQQSIHFVFGSDYNLNIWRRPFKLVSEIYYKHLTNLVPYEIDNVRLRYYAANNAEGYAAGVDIRLNGEFVKGIESWVSMSVMKTEEDIKDDYYYEYYNSSGEKIIAGYTFDQVATDSVLFEPGAIPRPTDQRIKFSLFFQDYLPKLPAFKMHLNLVFGTGLPFGPPTYERYKDILRITSYRRVDIGFSYQVFSKDKNKSEKNPFRRFQSVWVSAEVFNLLGTNNTISYIWIKDISNRQYAIPNYLTSRLLNVKVVVKI